MKADKKKSMHISVSYQGTMPVQEGHLGACGDDYMRLALYIDGYADSLAYAVVNFPMIEGRKVLFIHEIFLYQKGKTGRKFSFYCSHSVKCHALCRRFLLKNEEKYHSSMR